MGQPTAVMAAIVAMHVVTGGAYASDATPTEVINSLTSPSNTTTAPSGAIVMKDRAKPVENWFGCKPSAKGQTDDARNDEACRATDVTQSDGTKKTRETQ